MSTCSSDFGFYCPLLRSGAGTRRDPRDFILTLTDPSTRVSAGGGFFVLFGANRQIEGRK
jgi:hypothetical protein